MDDAQWKALQAERWDGLAVRWRSLGLPDSQDVQRLLVDLACAPGALLLDVGCGAGLWSVALARAGYRVRGIDLSTEMIAQARQLAGEYDVRPDSIALEVGSADDIDADDAVFDGIICRNVLDFVPSPAAALGELWRVLKPNGRLLLSVLGAHSPVKRELWRRFLPGAPAYPMNHILPWEAEALLGELGWKIVDGRANFRPAASGATNEYTPEIAERLGDRVVQQALASAWEVVAVKPVEVGWRDISDGRAADAKA